MKRNNEFIKRWINWLRSKEFDQTEQALHSPDGFCCLGVACHKSKKMKISKIDRKDRYVYKYDNGDKNSEFLPRKFREWIGITCAEEELLADMNDSGKSFDEIADWIEEHILHQEPNFFMQDKYEPTKEHYT